MSIGSKLSKLAAGLALLVAPAVARAGIQVGDELKVSIKTVAGPTITMEQLRGKLVVLDFWATWCGPCMQMVPHMVEMNEKYGGKGLQIIGVSLDQDRQQMLQVIKQKQMTWPEYFDGSGWDNKLWKELGSDGIPYTILVSPEGKVLYAGHPAAGLDQAIERAFKEHPPVLVDPKVLAQAKQQLDEVQKKIDAGDSRGAIKLMGRIPASARADGDFAAKAADVRKKLEESANALIGEVQTQIDQGKYVEAVPRLKELTEALSGLPASVQAKKMLSDLMSNPKARAAIAQAEKNAKANDALDVANKLKAQKKDELAYAHFKEIVKAFAGTDAASKADEQVKGYEKDAAFMKKASADATAAKANAALKLADSYRKAGRADLARKKYQTVVDEFPGTSYAATASKALGELDAQGS